MDTTQEMEARKAAALNAATQRPAGIAVEEYNPLESTPTVSVGDDFKPGMTLGGKYVETQIVESAKFKFSKTKGPKGLPSQELHILEVADGNRLGIWSVGELKLLFSKLPPGTYVEITYKNKGLNQAGQNQHFFDIKKGSVAQ